MFTDNTRDEVTLIFLKHWYDENDWILSNVTLTYAEARKLDGVNKAIHKTFAEVRKRNALGKQAGSYEAVAEQCDEFFKSIAAETVQVEK